MKRILLKKAELLRHLAMLLVTLCGFVTANAQLSSDEISEAILLEGSVPVKWTNDAEHPWIIGPTAEGSNELRTPESGEDSAFTSKVSFTFTSKYPTRLTFQWWRKTFYGEDILKMSVDGEEKGSTNYNGWRDVEVLLAEGTHTVEFTSISTRANNGDSGYCAAIRKVMIREFKELQSESLHEDSMPLVFENDTKNPWLTEDGYIRSLTQNAEERFSTISTTFTIDKPSMFTFEWRNSSRYWDEVQIHVNIDGVYYKSFSGENWNYESFVLYPGTHTVEFVHQHGEGYPGRTSQLRNIQLNQTWYDVKLDNPGDLAVRLLQALGDKNLQDAELVKISGSLNSDDWGTIKQLTGIKAIDFTETTITSISDEAFRNLACLSTVMLPETVKTIGNNAFRNTNLHRITIPASVEHIGWEAFRQTPLRYLSFAPESKLKKICYAAFLGTNLMEFIMPDSVTEVGRNNEPNNRSWSEDYYDNWDILAECKSLKKLHISEGLSLVPRGVAYNCTALEDVNIPSKATVIEWAAFAYTNITSIDLPETLTKIAYHAFLGSKLESMHIPPSVTDFGEGFASGCGSLKEVTLSPHSWNLNRSFSDCTALEKVVLPCATPPTISNDPFSGVNKANVILVVPDFAFETYRSDSYWYNFTNTVKGDEASIKDYWALRGNLNLNGNLVMQGNPSVEMMAGSRLTLENSSSQTFNEFTYHTSESSPAVVMSQSNSVKADRLVSKFYVKDANKWFFFSPVTDVKMSDISYPATDSWMICYYDGARRASEDAASGNWIAVGADETLKRGQGYIIQAREAGWLFMPAASTEEHGKFFGANAVTFDLADNACETEANAGWNFVANPYPTYYDIYYIDMQAPITVWDGSTYRAYSLNDGDRGDDTFVLRPMQPFFVQKSVADLSTGMPLVGRQVNTTIDRSRAPRPVVKDENRHKLNLELYCDDNETADDYTRVVLNEQASMAYETVRDASKFMSMDAGVAQLFTLGADGHPMAINERPYEDGNVALGVLLPAADRTYRISALRADRQAWLYDAETGMEFDLTDGDYIFTASKTGIDDKRFSIRFAPASTTSVDGINETVKVVGNTSSISVDAPAGAAVAVFGTDGSVVTNTVAESGTLEIPVAGGVYVVKVNGESHKTIVK